MASLPENHIFTTTKLAAMSIFKGAERQQQRVGAGTDSHGDLNANFRCLQGFIHMHIYIYIYIYLLSLI